MQPSVHLETADGVIHAVPHGGIIGRLEGAALVLPDPRVSEAHAMVSLRGGALHLLTLRGRFACGGRTPSALELVAGQQIAFARGLSVGVVRVALPERVLALRIGSGPAQVLRGVTSLLSGASPALVHGYDAQALAVFWPQDGAWMWREQGRATQPLVPGPLPLDGVGLVCRWVRTLELDRDVTRQLGGVAAPLRLVSHYDTVQLYREGQETVSISGNPARIISELIGFGTPVEWDLLARQIWRDETAPSRLRKKLDQTLLRLRRKLEAAQLRPDLVRADGSGKLELILAAGDRVEDRG